MTLAGSKDPLTTLAIAIWAAAAAIACGGRSGLGGPSDPAGRVEVSAIAAGGYASCAIDAVGGLHCWGGSGDGELGNGTFGTSPIPSAVTGLSEGVQAVSAGTYNVCAVASAGKLACWGYDGSSKSAVPASVTGLTSDTVGVATGGTTHTCALTNKGAVLCWGQNDHGQLGNGSTVGASVPVAVSGLDSGVVGIAAGNVHTCALTSAGGVWCWGGAADGQLGNGSITDSPVPIAVSGLNSGVARIVAGDLHTCALTDEGAVMCWGSNRFGQLGNGSSTSSPVPVAVSGLGSRVDGIASGSSSFHACAWAKSTIWCWGLNADGELGASGLPTGPTASSPSPVPVAGLAGGVASVTVGAYHTCALVSGRAYCWGSNASGQLGNAQVQAKSSGPVEVDGF
jgi:alpha-tubulin suppressor-like RCC1 family protein